MDFQRGSSTIIVSILIPLITAGAFAFSTVKQYRLNSERDRYRMPSEVKAVYLTSWSASTEARIQNVIRLAEETEINTVVIDIKDWSGNVFYNTDLKEFERTGAERIFLPEIESLIKRLHEKDIGVIARIVVFQDPVLAQARPELALKEDSEEQKVWKDSSGLAWVDPASEEVWEYNVKLARDVFRRGFDEVNFDYVRFPSDGNLSQIKYPVWDEKTDKQEVIANFFKYVRGNFPHKRLSVDLFGESTVRYNNLGVGQIIEDAFQHFDYVCPMVYPSHYSPGAFGFENPAQRPYQVVLRSMIVAQRRLEEFRKETDSPRGKLRPWLQDFGLEEEYGQQEVRKEIDAVRDALGDDYSGFMLWSSSNLYTERALEKRKK